MPVYQCKGSTGPAANTVFFPPVVKAVNMLLDYQFGTAVSDALGDPYLLNTYNVLNNISLWCPYNTNMDGGSDDQTVSFGSAVTAPDGTQTAYPMIEDSSNNYHFVTAGSGTLSESTFQMGRLRLAGIFKYFGRRIILEISIGRSVTAANLNGGNAVFDLLNGQIGPVATFGSSFGNLESYENPQAYIIPLGDGWYLCQFDLTVTLATTFNAARYALYLDNGIGTEPINKSYTGNGTSGVYGWLTNLLPARAWTLQNTVMFDDFDSLDTFDINNTLQPGYKWYVSSLWPGPDFRSYPPGYNNHGHSFPNGYLAGPSIGVPITNYGTGIFSISSPSVLEINAANFVAQTSVFNVFIGATSMAWNQQGSVSTEGNIFGPTFSPQYAVGNTWQRPIYVESSITWNNSMAANETAWWSRDATDLFDSAGVLEAHTENYCETDWFDTNLSNTSATPVNGNSTTDTQNTLLDDWFLRINYGIPDVWLLASHSQIEHSAWYDPSTSAFYALIQNYTAGSSGLPPTNPPWAPYSETLTGAFGATAVVPLRNAFSDDTIFQTYGVLMLPWVNGDFGYVCTFFNGAIVSYFLYAPNASIFGNVLQAPGTGVASTTFHCCDSRFYPMLLGVGELQTWYQYAKVIGP